MSVETVCDKCGAEYDMRHGSCPACGYSRKRRADKRGGSSVERVVSLSEYQVPDEAKRELVEIWLASNGNEAKALLDGFRLGFKTGVAAQANDPSSATAHKGGEK